MSTTEADLCLTTLTALAREAGIPMHSADPRGNKLILVASHVSSMGSTIERQGREIEVLKKEIKKLKGEG